VANFHTDLAAGSGIIVHPLSLLAHRFQFREPTSKRVRIVIAVGGLRVGSLFRRDMDCVSAHADARNDDVIAESFLMRQYGETLTVNATANLAAIALLSGIACVLLISVAQADGGTVQFTKSAAEVQLRKEDEASMSSVATHEAAQNKVFYAAQVNIPKSGVWDLEVTIRRGDDSATVSGTITVAPSNPVLLVYWRSLAIPPIFVSLFALNQWLKRRRRAAGQKREPRYSRNSGLIGERD
jgi:hypothetical protein